MLWEQTFLYLGFQVTGKWILTWKTLPQTEKICLDPRL